MRIIQQSFIANYVYRGKQRLYDNYSAKTHGTDVKMPL